MRRIGILALVGVFALSAAISVYLLAGKKQKTKQKEIPQALPTVKTTDSAATGQRNRAAPTHPFAKRAENMAEDEKTALAKKFSEEFKPAIEKWFQAYDGRIPFRIEDVTIEKFRSRVGDHMYTFMIGDITFTIQESKQGAKVSYLMTRTGAIELNKLPGQGFVPDVNIPITAEDVIRMVKADSGVAFKPDEVIIKPTALACALNGGAFVNLLPTGADPENALNYKISMVFGADGKLVNYERDPFF